MHDPTKANDDDVTRPMKRSTLPDFQTFNPRIRIIGVPVAQLPEPAQPAPPVQAQQSWDDAPVIPSVPAPAEIPPEIPSPVSVRAIMDVGPASAPSDDQFVEDALDEDALDEDALDEDAPATEPPVFSEPPTTRKPGAEESGVDVVSPPATDSDSGVRPARESSGRGVVTSAPELSSLDWDDRENRTDRITPEQALRWEEEEVTMPRHNDDLRAQARAIAAVNEVRRRSAERGPGGTLVDAASEDARTLVGDGHTLVDAEPPSSVVRESDPAADSAVLVSVENLIPRESLAEEPAPDTQPSTPPPALSYNARSIDIDLADLALSTPGHPPELASLIDEEGTEHTPPPRAMRVPSVPPEQGSNESFPPVFVDEDGTPQPLVPPRRRGGWYAISAVLLACLSVLAFVLYPKTGALDVRLETPEGDKVAKAEIFVDGQKKCDTDPCILQDLKPGTHVVKVVAAGRTAEATVTVRADEQARITVRLPALAEVAEEETAPAETAPTKLGVELDVITDGARIVLVQGRDTKVLSGPWPRTVELEPGSYKVVASRYGFAPFVQRVTLEAGDGVETLRIELEPAATPKNDTPAAKATATAVEVTAPAVEAPVTDGDIYE